MRDLELARLEREAEELQNRLNFYNSSEDYKQQAVDTLQKIEENALKREKILDKKGQKDRDLAANYKEMTMQRSYNATMQAYDMLAKGQLKSLDDFKEFAKLQLAELLYSLGNQHATWAASDLAIAVSNVVSNPTLAASKFAGAAKNAAIAAAFGVASSVVRGGDSSSGERETSRNNYDDEIPNKTLSLREIKQLLNIFKSSEPITIRVYKSQGYYDLKFLEKFRPVMIELLEVSLNLKTYDTNL